MRNLDGPRTIRQLSRSSYPSSLRTIFHRYDVRGEGKGIKPYKVCLNNLRLIVKHCLSNDLFNGGHHQGEH
jgi:hypothetical protein